MKFEALFHSLGFILVFLPILLAVYWAMPWRRGKLIVLITGGLVFYSFWDVRFAGLLLGAALVDFVVALRMARSSRPGRWLAASLVFNLGLLAFFKYAMFAADTARSIFDLVGIPAEIPYFSIVLPLGISFFTFKTLSYTIDVYRGEVPATRDIFQYVAFVALLPDIVAGPIVRYRDIAAQLASLPRRPEASAFTHGMVLFAIGLFKKVVVADGIARATGVYWVYSPLSITTPEAIVASLGYGLQLYFDFSGYSDMALGVAAMLGLVLPLNFRAPYQALNPSDFWRRWHISLSTWLRDYVYIPLGGNRGTRARVYVNLILVMAIGGLWHGAAWTFIIWGLYHGALLAYYKAWGKEWDASPVWAQRMTMLFAVFLGWMIFRAESLERLSGMLLAFGRAAEMSVWVDLAPTLVALAGLLVFTSVAPPTSDLRPSESRTRAAVASCLLGVSILVLAASAASPFLYYQF